MSQDLRPIIIGEILFDLFEDGQAILGGAPFNVAWHLQGFGQSPMFISRVGKDSRGEQIHNIMLEWGMDVAGLQTDTQHATGMVKVRVEHDQPSFDICDDVAYDYIDTTQVDSCLTNVSASFLYYGSLAVRHAIVYDTLQQLRQAIEVSFVDINLRPPWWDKSRVMNLIQGARCLKVNTEELVTLTGSKSELPHLIDAARILIQQHDIERVVITRAAQAALSVTATDVIQSQPVKVHKLQDTVGAGDAFSSVCMLGMLHHWDQQITLQRATEFAAKICEQRGATCHDIKLYDFYTQQWQLR